MTELERLAQPYPDNKPWVDLMAFIEPSWRTGMTTASFHFNGLIEGNTAHLHLRTRRGTNSIVVLNLPDAFVPEGNKMLQAFSPWHDFGIGMHLRTDGTLRLYTPGRSLADGSVEDLSFQYSYTRKVG